MGLFRKKSSTHFERDEKGNVIGVIHSGDKVKSSGTRVSNKLLEQYYEKHPEERRSAKVKAGALKLGKRLDNWSKDYNKSSAKRGPILVMNPPKKSSGKPPLALEMFNFGSPGDSIKKPSKGSGEVGRKYIIRGGKAYPIVGSGNKTKAKKSSGGKKKKYNPNDPFDFPSIKGW